MPLNDFGIKDKLKDFMISQLGTPESHAEIAAEACTTELWNSGKTGLAIGAAIGLATSNPETLIMCSLTGAGVSAIAAFGSPACNDVREAIYSKVKEELGQ
jgi:hypothetical protein